MIRPNQAAPTSTKRSLAIEFALETTSVGEVPVPLGPGRERVPRAYERQPVRAPWIMRGLLEEDFVKTQRHGAAEAV